MSVGSVMVQEMEKVMDVLTKIVGEAASASGWVKTEVKIGLFSHCRVPCMLCWCVTISCLPHGPLWHFPLQLCAI